MTASARFICAFAVDKMRFIAAGGAESPSSRTPPEIALMPISTSDLAREYYHDKDA